LRCRQQDASAGLQSLREKFGIDPFEDLDQIAMTGDLLAVSGYFENLQVPEGIGAGESYGDAAKIYSVPVPEGGEGEQRHRRQQPQFLATVGGGLILVGESAQQLQAAVDRVEGRAASTEEMNLENAYGEIYGRVGPSFVKDLLANSQEPLAQRLQELVTEGEVRMNVDEHVSMNMDVTAVGEQEAEDLSRAIGGALAAARRWSIRASVGIATTIVKNSRRRPGRPRSRPVPSVIPVYHLAPSPARWPRSMVEARSSSRSTPSATAR